MTVHILGYPNTLVPWKVIIKTIRNECSVDRNLFACYSVLNIYFKSRNRFLRGREAGEVVGALEAGALEAGAEAGALEAGAEGRRRGRMYVLIF